MIKPVAFAAVLPAIPTLSPVIDPTTFTPSFEGELDGKGGWSGGHPDWIQERLGVGNYKITHNLNYKTGIIVSANTAEGVGSLYIAENTPTYLRITTSLNDVPTDLAVVFTISQVASLVALR
jgi:hypothetical protein